MWRASVLTIFPEMFPGTLGMSLAGKALAAGTTWSLDVTDIRAHATDKHRTVDDTPAGGGPGMVMKRRRAGARARRRVLGRRHPPSPLHVAARHAADAGAGRDAGARARRRDPVRAVRGRRRAHHRGAELLRDLDRRLRALGRRGRGHRADRRLRAAPARRHGPDGLGRRGELLAGAARSIRNTPGRSCSRAAASRRC